MSLAIITLSIGILIGYLGQRSRFCIVSGIRDYFLLKNSYRLKGFLGLILGALFGFMVFRLLGSDMPSLPISSQFGSAASIMLVIVGGMGLGFFSVLAEGCPFRQHVMAAEGRKSAIFYLVGFYIGIIYFYLVTFNFVKLFLSLTR